MSDFLSTVPQPTAGEVTSGPVIGICHRTRLFAECLERALTLWAPCTCRLLDPAEVLQGSLDARGKTLTLLLLDSAISSAELACLVMRLRKDSPLCRLLFLVPEAATERLVQLMQLGTQGCVRENGTLSELCNALGQVLSGKHYYSSELANALCEQLNGCDPRQPWSSYLDESQLTAREREVLWLIACEDLGNKQIARRLHVSLYTVKNHVHNIIEKLGVNDRHDAARRARRRNLIGETMNRSAVAAHLEPAGEFSLER